jgi:hypothetical protein
MKQEQANLTFAVLKLIKQKENQLVRKVLESKLNRKPTIREIGSVHKKPNDDNTVEIYFKSKRLGKITYEMIDKELSLNFDE